MSEYSAPPAAPPAAPSGATNTLAIIALIAAFVLPPAGIVVGHIALGQIKRTGEAGHGLALWGTILGYLFTIAYVMFFVVLPIVLLLFAGTIATIPGGTY